jgi:dynein intermediate chain 1
LAVYRIQYNPFDPEFFVSASADWTVKIWSVLSKKELMSFGLGVSLIDV